MYPGDQEVVGDIEENHEQEQAPAGQVAAEQRPSIDHMIERLQREQDQRMATGRGRPLASPPPVPGASPRASRSNSGNWRNFIFNVKNIKYFQSYKPYDLRKVRRMLYFIMCNLFLILILSRGLPIMVDCS